MDTIFSPTRTVATHMSENTPLENTAKVLFKEPPKAQTAPLTTITNIRTDMMISEEEEDEEPALSPSLQNVSQLKKAFAKMEKENKQKVDSAWKRKIPIPSSGRGRGGANKRQTSGKVQEMREKIAERKLVSSVAQTPVLGNRNVKIPMNKVQEMRNILLDFQRNQAKQKELIHMSSKKRAKIAERLNKVQDIHKWLNELEQQSKKNGSNLNTASTGPKTKELNLPMNRVNEMKNWLVEFERQNKEHSNRFSTKSTSVTNHQGGGYIPITRKKQSLNGEDSRRQVGAEGSAYCPSTPDVSNLAQFLIDFEQKNKEHYERSQKKGSGMGVIRQPKSDAGISETFDVYTGEQSDEVHESEINDGENMDEETIEGVSIEGEDEDDDTDIKAEEDLKGEVHVEDEYEDSEADYEEDCNEVIEKTEEINDGDNETEEEEIDEGDNEVASNGSSDESDESLVFENTSILESDHQQKDMNTSMIPTTNNMDQSEWEDDYDDLMKVNVNIEPVQSTESWDSDTFTSSKINETGSKEIEEESAGSQWANEDSNASDDDVAKEEGHYDGENNDTWDHFSDNVGFNSMIDNSNAFSGEDTNLDNTVDNDIASTGDYTDLDNTVDKEVALESDEVSNEEILSTSHYGPRFSTSFMLPPDVIKTEKVEKANDYTASQADNFKGQSKKNTKGGLGCVYKSIFKIFKKKGSIMQEESNDNNGIEMGEYLLSKQGGQISPASVQEDSNLSAFDQVGYIPNAYSNRNEEPQDFARDMVLGRACSQFDPSSESPISLASAFRRTMSPTASSCAGSELAGVHALINANHTNVAQHVGWLQGHFQSPKAADKTRSIEGTKL